MSKEKSAVPDRPKPKHLTGSTKKDNDKLKVAPSTPKNATVDAPIIPCLTTLINKKDTKPQRLSSDTITEDSTDAEDSGVSVTTSDSSILLSARSETRQPYPFDERQKSHIVDASEIPNKIVLKISQEDGGVIFFVPTHLNYFLEQVFNKYADTVTYLLSEDKFEIMLSDARLLSNILKSKPPQKKVVPAKKTSKQTNKSPCTQKHVTLHKDESIEKQYQEHKIKVLQCIFRHRDNCDGHPIPYGQFLRVLHRLARYKYRRLRIRDDEAVNCLVAAIARSGVWVNPNKSVISHTDSSVQATTETTEASTQLEKKSLKSSEVMTDPLPVPKAIEKIIPKSSIKQTPIVKKKEIIQKPVETTLPPKPIPKTIPPPKIELSRVTHQGPEQLPLLSDHNTSDGSETTRSSVLEHREIDFLEKKSYEIFRLYCDNKRGEIPLMTSFGFHALCLDSGLEREFDTDDLNELYHIFLQHKIEMHDFTNGIDFLDFKNILQELSNEFSNEDQENTDEAYYYFIRTFLLTLLYHKDHEIKEDLDESCLEKFHVVDEFGRVIDPETDTPFEDLFIGPDGLVVNSTGDILPGALYTQDGLPFNTSSFNYTCDIKDGTIKDMIGRVIPGYQLIRGPNGTVIDNLYVGPNHKILPIQPDVSTTIAQECPNIVNPISLPVLNKHDSIVNGADLDQNIITAKINKHSPQLTRCIASSCQIPNNVYNILNLKTSSHIYTHTNNKPHQAITSLASTSTIYNDSIQRMPPNKDYESNLSYSQKDLISQPVSSQFTESPYVVTFLGQVVRESDGLPVEGFNVGPGGTIIGPDGRQVWNARIGNDGRTIETFSAEEQEEKRILLQQQLTVLPKYLDNFPAGWDTLSHDSDDSLYFYNENDINDYHEKNWDYNNSNSRSSKQKKKKVSPNKKKQLYETSMEINNADFGLSKRPPRLVLQRYDKNEGVIVHKKDQMHINNEDDDVYIEGFIWPPMQTVVPSGIDTPRFEK